jgi:dTDP-4-amino-4,6-dideoxygalactose transaminase
MNWIPLNKYYVTGQEIEGINRVIESGHLSGRGTASLLSEKALRDLGFNNPRLTPSCTAALEAAALFLNIGPGDEVIIPSYTFVATATAFANRGARIVFADSCADHPNIDCSLLESLITPLTKAIVVVHYGGTRCDMETARAICSKHNIALIEDAAHAFLSRKSDGTLLGTDGDIACFSFHDTKNISCGEGGMITRNNDLSQKEWSVLLNKGTNREAFESGTVNHYEWTGLGGSFGLSELQAAFLYYQLQFAEEITNKRRMVWNTLFQELNQLQNEGVLSLPIIKSLKHNAHVFYLELENTNQVDALIAFMKSRSITCARHYYPLHQSAFGEKFSTGVAPCPNAAGFGESLLRLPVYSGMSDQDLSRITEGIKSYFKG